MPSQMDYDKMEFGLQDEPNRRPRQSYPLICRVWLKA